MDLVVRTPHGDADLTVVSWAGAATIADLVHLTTGQSSPPLIHVDDRPVDSTTHLDDAPILFGSVLSSHPAHDERTAGLGVGVVRLVQLTGRGAGTTRTLAVGRYRIGPGRRRLASELADAPVERAIFELDVGAAGDEDPGGAVSVTPTSPGTLLLGGQPIDGSSAWSPGQSLRVGARVFALERADATEATEVRGATGRFDVEPDGTIQFSRSPLITHDEQANQIAHSVRAARTFDASLWRRRIDSTGAMTLTFGLADEDVAGQLRPVSITIESTRPAAIAGSVAFRDGIARTLLIDAAARYGPADLAIAVATRPDRLGEWDWAKWLPHVRLTGHIALMSSPPELSDWAGSLKDSTGTTLLVIDDSDLWSRSDSPLRELVSTPPTNLAMLALADRIERAPAGTSSIIAQEPGDMCRLVSAGRSLGVIPAIVESDVALDVARALAPLRDAELAPGHDEQGTGITGVTLSAAIDATSSGPTVSSPPYVVLGTDSVGEPTYREWVPGSTWSITGADVDHVTTVAVTVLLSIAAGSSPAGMPMVIIGPERSPLAQIVTRLAHFAGWCDPRDVHTRERLFSRLTHLLDEGGSAVVIVDLDPDDPSHAPDDRSDDTAELLAELRSISDGNLGLHVLIVSSTATSMSVAGTRDPDVSIAVNRGARGTHGSVLGTDGDAAQAFIPFSLGAEPSGDELVLKPFVFGRPLTTLERRLERTWPNGGTFDLDEATSKLIDTVGRAHGDTAIPPQLVPVQLPTQISLEQLLADNEADAVPIGLVDDPVRGRHEPVWWQSGADGSMLFIGTPRAGLDVVISSLTVGIAERFTPSDLIVYAIDASNRRLSALRQIAHTTASAALERLDRVAEIVDLVANEVLDRRRTDDDGKLGRTDRPNVLLLIGDLTQLGRRLRDSSYAPTLDRLALAASGADVGVNIVATASRASDSCGLADIIDTIFVGSLASANDAAGLGIDNSLLATLGVGRCRRLATGELIQLAQP